MLLPNGKVYFLPGLRLYNLRPQDREEPGRHSRLQLWLRRQEPLTSLADPSGVRSQTFDNSGRLSTVSRGNQTFRHGYDADGTVTPRVWPDGTTVTASYDGNDRMTALSVLGGAAGSTAARYGFTYDLSGRLIHVTTPTGTTSASYACDASGNLVQAGADTFTDNLEGTLASATAGGVTAQYAYDAKGIQLSMTATQNGSQVLSRTWQTDVNAVMPMLAEQTVSQGGAISTQGFVVGPQGVALGMVTGGQTDSYVPDFIGGAADLMPASGTSLASYDYDPFGDPRSDGTAATSSSVDNPIRFAGG